MTPQNPAIERLMHANLLEVFNERDRSRRAAAIAATYSPDIRWTDDEGVTTGHEALDAKAQLLLDGQMTGMHFAAGGPVYETLGLGYLAWNVLADGGAEPVVSGFDVAVVKDDVITELWTVVTKQPG